MYTGFIIFSSSQANQLQMKIALCFFTCVNNTSIMINTLATSGTIKSLEDKLIYFTWQRLHYEKDKANDEETRMAIVEAIEKCRPFLIKEANKEYKCDFNYFSKMFNSINMKFF